MSRSLNLFRLQQIDSKIDRADIRLKQIKVLLSDDQNFKKASLQAANAKEYMQSAQNKQRQAETKVKDQRIKIEQVEATLYGGTVRNPKELQDLQNEVDALKRFLDTLEERQLEAMLIVDDAKVQLTETQDILKKYQVEFDKKQSALIKEQEQILKERTKFLEEREVAESLIGPDDLVTYDRLRKQRAGVAVAKVEQRACNACGSTLTAALHQAARSPSQVVNCDSCGRILFST